MEEPVAGITERPTVDITTDFAAYEARRPEVFRTLVPLRRTRRVRVGDLLVFEFENAQSLQIQVQEMVYVERVTDPEAVQHEIEAYQRLLPTTHSLTATMLIELEAGSGQSVREALAELEGIQRSVWLTVGDTRVPGVEIPGPDEDPDVPSETVSVHMLRFTMTDAQRDAFRDPSQLAELVVAHPAYDDATPITGETRLALIADLAL